MPRYSPEQLQKICDELPDDLQEAVFSEEVGRNISEICNENGVVEADEISEVLEQVGYVFLGLLAPVNFQKVLEQELEIPANQSRLIAQGINRFVFYPLRNTLEPLYGVKLPVSEKIKDPIPLVPEPGLPAREKENKQYKKKDTYREPVE